MAIPYENVGTATVTAGQSAVVGQGTRWSRCKIGDVFCGRAGERNIVVNIADDTHLDLMFPAISGQAAQGFAVMRTPDDVYTQTMARDVFQKITDSAFLALAGVPPSARKGVRFDANSIAEMFNFADKGVELVGKATETDMRQLLNVAPKQANSLDTTAGAGLTVGAFGLGSVSPARFSGDVNTILTNSTRAIEGASNLPAATAGVLQTLMFDNTIWGIQIFTSVADGRIWWRWLANSVWGTWFRSWTARDVFGTVSVSGGSQLGALIEKGTDGTRHYARFANGLQYCWGNPGTQMAPTNVQTGGGYQATVPNTYGFLAGFSSSPTVVASASFSSQARGWVSLLEVPTTTSVSLIAHSFASGALIVPYFEAIGWWL